MSWRESLRGKTESIPEKTMTVGFDGFVDTIVHPLKQTASVSSEAVPFRTIREFGEFLEGKAEKSCSIELETQAEQLGGNLPFLSRAAGGLGISVSCIGMLGSRRIVDPVFSEMPCTLYPFAAPGRSTCMEFDDGKILLASDCVLPDDAWKLVMDGTEGKAPDLFRRADLIALVNWSELSFMQGLWEHVLEELQSEDPDRERYAYFDLCDMSRRSTGEIESVVRLIRAFTKYRRTTLSLNENEAQIAADRLLNLRSDDALKIAEEIRNRFRIDEVIVHTIRRTVLTTERGTVDEQTEFVEKPVISTGAGDNFNGASCFAILMGLSEAERVAFADEFAHFYITQGRNPALQELIDRSTDGK